MVKVNIKLTVAEARLVRVLIARVADHLDYDGELGAFTDDGDIKLSMSTDNFGHLIEAIRKLDKVIYE